MPPSAPTPISPDQTARLVAALRANRSAFWEVMEQLGLQGSISEMTSVEAVKVLSALQRKRSLQAKGQPEEA
jgi:hypothetical protein